MKSREAAVLGAGDDSPLLSKEEECNPGSIRLCIFRMDNTSFDVSVPGTASVLELKKAIEDKFGNSQMEEGKISWCHVWGNFCLTYEDRELVNDGSLLSSFGIKDSDELFFVRHMSSASQGEKLHRRKHSTFGVLKKKSSDGANMNGHKTFTHIELHWTRSIRTWFVYTKLWIVGMKADSKNVHRKH
jgi:hypothetical protein